MKTLKRIHDLIDQFAHFGEEELKSLERDLLHRLNVNEGWAADELLPRDDRYQARLDRRLARYEQQFGKEKADAFREKLARAKEAFDKGEDFDW